MRYLKFAALVFLMALSVSIFVLEEHANADEKEATGQITINLFFRDKPEAGYDLAVTNMKDEIIKRGLTDENGLLKVPMSEAMPVRVYFNGGSGHVDLNYPGGFFACEIDLCAQCYGRGTKIISAGRHPGIGKSSRVEVVECNACNGAGGKVR